jgi:hypothetical protein
MYPRIRLPLQRWFCAGQIHVDLALPAPLDVRAKTGPARIALIEDGAAFCRSCAYELFRSGSDAPT